jgi:hypothetical protein
VRDASPVGEAVSFPYTATERGRRTKLWRCPPTARVVMPCSAAGVLSAPMMVSITGVTVVVTVRGVPIVIVGIIVVTVISVRIAPVPPPGKPKVVEEDDIIESVMVMTPIAAPPVAAAPHTRSAAHWTEMAGTATTKTSPVETATTKASAMETAAAEAASAVTSGESCVRKGDRCDPD